MSLTPETLNSQALALCKQGDAAAAADLFRGHPHLLSLQEVLYGACILASTGQIEEALLLLRKLKRRRSDFTPTDSMPLFACCILEDVLAVTDEGRSLNKLHFYKRNRLLKLIYYLFVSPAVVILKLVGKLFQACRFPDGMTLQRLAEHLTCQCWVNGLPARPAFLMEPIVLNLAEDLKDAHRTYRQCFLAYLRYWLPSGHDPAGVLLAIVKPGDAHALYCLVRRHKPSVILEIGTFTGFSTSILAHAVQDNGKGTIHCIDPNLQHLGIDSPMDHAGQILRQQHLDHLVTKHEGFFSDPREGSLSDPAVLGRQASLLLPPVDFAFIDGSHATNDVVLDFRFLLPALADNAVLVFHDVTTWYSVRQAIQLIMSDDIWGGCLEYHDMEPSGFDGLGVMYFQRSRPKGKN